VKRAQGSLRTIWNRGTNTLALFDSLVVGQTHYVEYDGADVAVFRDDELEGLPGQYRLIRLGGDEIQPCEQPTDE
jgi:hypothetical protein